MDQPHKPKRPEKLPALTSLRFFAAAMIVLHHSLGSFGIPRELHNYFPTTQGVSFFFVLSGFVLTYVYKSFDSNKAIGHFLLARFARIWPLHVTTLLIAIAFLSIDLRVDTLLSNVFMVHAWVPNWEYFMSYNSLSWAISTEFAFYLLFPFLIYQWRRTWHIKIIFAFLIIIGIIFCSNYYNLTSGMNGKIGYIGFIYINPLGRLFEFTFGMLMALVYEKFLPIYQPEITRATMAELLVLFIVPGVMLATPFLCMFALPWIGLSGILWVGEGGLSCFFFGLLILIMAFQKGIISRLLSWKIFIILGELSLSIYLLHQIILRYYRFKIEGYFSIPDWIAYTYFWVILLFSSHFLWLFIEQPCRKFIVNFILKIKINRIVFKLNLNKIKTDLQKRIIKFSALNFLKEKRILIIEIIAFIFLICPVYYKIKNINYINIINADSASRMLFETGCENWNVTFGNKFILMGSKIIQKIDGLEIKLFWKNIVDQRLSYVNAIHLVDTKGNILFQSDYLQDKGNSIVRAGTIWLDKIDIPRSKLKNVAAIAIGIFSADSGLLPADHGPRDWDGKRLLINLN